MAFCVHCGYEISTGTRFCSSCGKEQNVSTSNCSKCGKVLEENEKFCSGCGTPAGGKAVSKPKTEPQPIPKTKEENLTKEGRKIISGGPKATLNKQASAPLPPVKKKKKGCMGCLGKSLLIIGVLIVVGIVIIWNLPDEDDDKLTDTNIPGIVDIEPDDVKSEAKWSKDENLGLEIPVKIKGKSVSKETKTVSQENTVASFKKVKIDFGQFILDEETSLKVEELQEQIIDDECSVVAYDIELKGKNKFDDYMTISLPYNEAFIKNGKAEECVAAQYYNPKTKSWEPVLYELDTEKKLVNIFTDHLSRYGVFTVKNAKKRNAFITGVYIPDRYLLGDKKGMHVEVLKNYYENDKDLGKEAFNHGLSFWGKFSGESGVAINTLTAGGSYSTEYIGKLNDGFKNLGYVASVVQLGYDLCYSNKEDKNKTTAINLTKNIMNQLVAEYGTPAINVAFIGVYIIDVTLNEFGNAMLAQKYKELFDVYDYYNKTYNERSLKEWRRLMIDIHKDYPEDPYKAYEEIMGEIDDYAWKFMKTTNIGKNNENTVELNALAGEAGLKRMTWPLAKDVEGVYGEGKQRIIDKLYPVFTSVNNWRLKNLKMELTKEASLLAKELSKKISLTITENLNNGEKPKFGGHRVAIRPLGKDADKKQWTGKLNKQGYLKTSLTLIGYLLAGEPNTIKIYEPNDIPDNDAPVFEKQFVLDPNGTTVYLSKKASKIEARPITLFHEHTKTKEDQITAKNRVNDPLAVIGSIRDFTIEINKDGSFAKTLPGQKFEVYYGEKQGTLYDGYVFNAGSISLKGQINTQAFFSAIDRGFITISNRAKDLKVGTMKYVSGGSLTEQEIINASSWGGEDRADILQDYSHTAQANFDLYLVNYDRENDSYYIYAYSENGKYQIKNNPSAEFQKKDYNNISGSSTIYFKIITK